MTLRSLLLASAALVLAAQPLRALELPLSSSRAQLEAAQTPPYQAKPGDEIVIRGRVLGDAPQNVVLRMDDGASRDYASRVNEERVLPPGPFTWTHPLFGARAVNGRVLNPQELTGFYLFVASKGGRMEVDDAQIRAAAPLPNGARGYSFGAADAPVFPGFERIAPKDPRIEAGPAIPTRRPGVDALLSSGMRALERVRLPYPPGRVRVTLWTEDVGEWETLPQALHRRIRINGKEALYELMTPAQWIERRYLAGRNEEIGAQPDAWETYGKRRGGMVSAEVDVGANGVVLELAGESAVSTFLSAALIEPASSRAAFEDVQKRRAEWFNSLWRIDARLRESAPAPKIELARASEAPAAPLRIALGRGTGGRVAFEVVAQETQAAKIDLSPPALGDSRLALDIWAGQRRLERRTVGLNMLTPTQDMLRGEPADLPLHAGVPRRYVAWVSAPEGASPGVHRGSVTISAPGGKVVQPLEIEVMDAAPPAAPRPAGFYLDEAPHLTWFPGMGGERRKQVGCDLAILARLGITGNAPALATPVAGGEDAFVVDSLSAARNANSAPWLAYTPAKRTRQQVGEAAAARVLAQASTGLRDLGLTAPIWSIADEPSNAGHSEGDLATWARSLRAADSRVKLAAQLNHPSDMKVIDLFDTVLINEGFGIDVRDVAQAARRGRDVWLYNTGRPRFTAGYWLPATGAARYLQWHARMPTADAFDPTDGREGDMQMLFPTPQACPARHDIHTDVLEMAEGLVDQRWLAWLDKRQEPEARALHDSIASAAPDGWRTALARHHNGVGPRAAASLDALRGSIMDLARRLK
ncbi:MAG: hypothetical protein JWN93_3708 [Hyphomicrobiales bacterium]|nr:hypothetical protein [Hyphomicrobiales bacterium]